MAPGMTMAESGPLPVTWTWEAGADLRTYQFQPMALDANGRVVLANVSADAYVGVLQNKPNSLEHATIALTGITKAKVGLAVTRRDYLTVQSGWFITGNKQIYTRADSGQTDEYALNNYSSRTTLYGMALETVSSGGMATVFLFPHPTVINTQ